jgi:peptide/nickel transport system ATP-binding protein
VIAQVSDRVTVLRGGRVVEQGPTRRVLGTPEQPYTRALMAAVPRLDRRLDRFHLPRVGTEVADPALAALAAEAEDWLMSGTTGGTGPSLDLSEITVRFRGERQHPLRSAPDLVALDAVSLSVRPGTVMGLVGESGSGKSTLAKVVAALVQPAGGACGSTARRCRPCGPEKGAIRRAG